MRILRELIFYPHIGGPVDVSLFRRAKKIHRAEVCLENAQNGRLNMLDTIDCFAYSPAHNFAFRRFD